MDPVSPQPQGENQNLQKLEQDLQNLSTDAAAQNPSSGTPTPPPPVSQPAATPPVEGPKGSSMIMKVAISLLAVALVAAIVYVLYVRFGSQISLSTSPTVAPQTIVPLPSAVGVTPTPVESPLSTASATPTASSSPTSSPSASPTTPPGY